RVAGRLEDAGYHVEADLHVPSTVSNITTRVDDLLLKIEEFRHQRGHNQFLLIYNRPSPPASFYPIRRQLLPVDFEWLHSLARKKWDSPSLPVMTMDWSEMFSSLIRQHLFVSLFRAFAESIASENSSRLASMQVA